MQELDTVILTTILATDLPRHGLSAGDLGIVVLLLKDGGYEVEFMTRDGGTVAVVSSSSEQLRPTGRRDKERAGEGDS
jgi:hypothetical protein